MAKKKILEEDFILKTIKYLMEHKIQLSEEERQQKFGMSASCDMIVEGDLIAIIVDNPLPDDDVAIFVTNKEKIIDSVLGKVGSKFMNEAKDVKFFE